MEEKTILVVDNSPIMLKFMSDFLKKEGYRVLIAEDGLVALDLLKTTKPSVIFTDLIMPNIDGERLCRIIRSDPELKDIYLVVLSAVVAERELGLKQLGADMYIGKTSFNRLTRHLRLALKEGVPGNGNGKKREGRCVEIDNPRQITRELLLGRRHLEVILESMEEGIIEATPAGRIIYGNPAAISLVGLKEESLLGLDVESLFNDEDRKRVKHLLFRLNAPAGKKNGEAPYRLHGKEVAIHLIPVADEENPTALLLLHDVTEKRRMETQLLQAQKMEAVGTLAGGVAHDFNNLLMVVKGYASLMLLEIDPSHPHYEMLRTIEKKIDNGSKLTRQLLGYAKKGRYEFKTIPLNRLVEETAETFGRTRKNITIRLDLSAGLSPLEADPSQMEQVLMNLLVNAADAMPGGGELFLKTANVTNGDFDPQLYDVEPGKYVLLSVGDTGIGMSDEIKSRIFEPFFTTKDPGRGTGLGLASVYGIVKGHGGYIDVDSEEGKGTTFRIYLPASEKKIEETPCRREEIPKGSESILLVDDEEHILDVGKKMLGILNYRVLTASGGEQAVELHKSNREQIDLTILDLIMPQMGGKETFEAIKKISPTAKVLLSSGYSMDGQTKEIMKNGCKGFIQKPFSIRELSYKVREILDRGKHEGQT